jgi:hypothetical protein
MKKLCPVWEEQELTERLSKCRQMLYLHGVLPAGENEKVKLRITKLAYKEEV